MAERLYKRGDIVSYHGAGRPRIDALIVQHVKHAFHGVQILTAEMYYGDFTYDRLTAPASDFIYLGRMATQEELDRAARGDLEKDRPLKDRPLEVGDPVVHRDSTDRDLYVSDTDRPIEGERIITARRHNDERVWAGRESEFRRPTDDDDRATHALGMMPPADRESKEMFLRGIGHKIPTEGGPITTYKNIFLDSYVQIKPDRVADVKAGVPIDKHTRFRVAKLIRDAQFDSGMGAALTIDTTGGVPLVYFVLDADWIDLAQKDDFTDGPHPSRKRRCVAFLYRGETYDTRRWDKTHFVDEEEWRRSMVWRGAESAEFIGFIESTTVLI